MPWLKKLNSIRFKVFLGLFLIQAITIVGYGVLLFQETKREYFEQFQNRVLAIANTVKAGLNAAEHYSFRSAQDIEKPGYTAALRFLQNVKRQDPFITYLYTINYDRDQDRLYYVLDGSVFDTDTVWVENEIFAFYFQVKNDGNLLFHHNSKTYDKGFSFDTEKGKIEVSALKSTQSATIIQEIFF